MSLPRLSLSKRLWLVLAVAILPLFVLTIIDYRFQRTDAVRNVERDARQILDGALIAEEAAILQVHRLLRVLAGADDLTELDPQRCDGLTARLRAVHDEMSSIGVASPAGEILCSSPRTSAPVSVADREWFREVQEARGPTGGQFVVGRISGQPVAVFGYPMRHPDGSLRAAAFVSSSVQWFDHFTRLSNLPPGWTALLYSREGRVLSHFPVPEQWRGHALGEASRQRFRAALAAGESSLVMRGVDGQERLFMLRPLSFGKGELIAALGVPVADTLIPLQKRFHTRLLLLLGLTLLSLLAARHLLHEMVDRRFARTLDELRRLHTALDHVPAYVYMKDRERRYVYGNRVTRELFGCTPEELRGSPDERFFPPGTVQRLREVDSRVLAGENTEEIIEVPGQGGARRVYLEIKTPIFSGDNGRVEGLCGISTDITRLMESEEAVRKLSLAIEQSPDSIVFTDLEARIEYVNEAFLRVTGYTREEVLGRNPNMLRSGATPPETYTQMWQTLARGEVWQGEFLNVRKDGSEYLEHATISPLRQPDGRITHYVAVKTDITAQRAAENELAAYRSGLEALVRQRTAELAEAKEAAESASRAKSAFLANMSHEIRTPMNAIIGLNHLLLQDAPTPAQAERLRKMHAAAGHLLQIITDILDLSKIEAGKLDLEQTVFAPCDLLDSVAAMIRDGAVARGLELQVDCDGLPPRLAGDAARLRQILLNFAGNALKFTERGSIHISGQVLANEGDALLCRFVVRDTGIGIEPAQRERLFHPFEQLDSSTTRRFGGTGLGLAIARRLVELMGGEIGVDSSPGAGSSFWFTARLPLATAPAAAPPAPVAATPVPQLRGQVLIAEDEPVNREIGLHLLRAAGLQASAVEDGQAAVEAVRAQAFDLVLMDVHMPRLDGLAATAAIRALPAGAALPIVALTGNALAGDRQRCLAAGMNDYLAKPVEPAALYAVLARYLPTGAAPVPAPLPPLLDAATLDAGLQSLCRLLESGNVEAINCHRTLGATLQQRHPAAAQRLADLLAAYDFDGALALLRSLPGAVPAAPLRGDAGGATLPAEQPRKQGETEQ